MTQPWTARKGKRPRNWSAWFDGSTRLIRRGIDFECKVETMRIQLYTKAKDFGGHCTAERDETDENAIRFRFIPDEGASE